MGETGQGVPQLVDVANRALGICLLVNRGMFEEMTHDLDVDEAKHAHLAMAKRLSERVAAYGVWDALPPQAQLLLSKPPGTWSRQDSHEAGWFTEDLTALLWALSLCEMPTWEARVKADVAIRMVRPHEHPQLFISRCTLRTESELLDMLEAASLWRSRANLRLMEELEIDLPPGVEMGALVADVARQAFAHGCAGEPVDGDLPVLGKPYRQLGEAEFRNVNLIATHREQSLRSLGGGTQGEEPSNPPSLRLTLN